MQANELIRRARDAMSPPTLYFLGEGGFHEGRPLPVHPGTPAVVRHRLAWLAENEPARHARYRAEARAAGIDLEALERSDEPVPLCDCSGYVTWALALPRSVTVPGRRDKLWRSTAFIYGVASQPGGEFRRIDSDAQPLVCRPGAMLVYPAPDDEEPGHIGIVTETDTGGVGRPLRVLHCSSLNQLIPRPSGAPLNAIAETDPQVFVDKLSARRPTIAVWHRDVTE